MAVVIHAALRLDNMGEWGAGPAWQPPLRSSQREFEPLSFLSNYGWNSANLVCDGQSVWKKNDSTAPTLATAAGTRRNTAFANDADLMLVNRTWTVLLVRGAAGNLACERQTNSSLANTHWWDAAGGPPCLWCWGDPCRILFVRWLHIAQKVPGMTGRLSGENKTPCTEQCYNERGLKTSSKAPWKSVFYGHINNFQGENLRSEMDEQYMKYWLFCQLFRRFYLLKEYTQFSSFAARP